MKNKADTELYSKALEAKAKILQEIAACHTQLEKLKAQLTDTEGFIRTVDRLRVGYSGAPLNVTARKKPTRRATKRQCVENATKALLKEESVISTAKLLAVLESQGILVGGTNPEGNLAAILSKSRAFVNSRAAGGWMLGTGDSESQAATL